MYELQVENMSCGHCVASVTKAVKAIDGAAQVDVDLAGKQVKVASAAPLEAVKAAITDAGYPVTVAR
ncbi:heavy-metal-associated domain-containing protein [Pseudoduganella armeniaca]|uniref:Copper chaperone n=1 Tax=Pseudoduganella armeniaca TaxID=2072590 RepID=A0A2R4CE93_9BURK|nr:cation transporter [Pseudoduganella armeniaca]AVR97953.1 copper chaperone [Pseudoduganella armeniaca]